MVRILGLDPRRAHPGQQVCRRRHLSQPALEGHLGHCRCDMRRHLAHPCQRRVQAALRQVFGTNTIGRGLIDAIARTASWVDALALADTPTRAVGRRARTASAKLPMGACGCAYIHLHAAYRDPVLGRAAYAIFMTGPSATADTEGVLVHGAQGIRSLTAVPLAAPHRRK